MTEEEVKKQEKRIAKFNQLNGELLNLLFLTK